MEEHKNNITKAKESDVLYGLSTDELYEKAEVDKIKRNLLMDDISVLKKFIGMMKLHIMLKSISLNNNK